jgi:hypothetical protein
VKLSFWQIFLLLLVFVPLVLVWGFSLFDIFRRRDLGPVATTFWFVTVIILPLVGTAVYLVFRSRSRSSEARDVPQEVNATLSQWIDTSTRAQLQNLTDVHDAGEITDAEFAARAKRLGMVTAPGEPHSTAKTTDKRSPS